MSGILSMVVNGGGTFSPLSLAPTGWYDSSDAATLFTDAGTTPAGIGDPVGRWADKSGNGRHFNTTGGNRPTRQANRINFNGSHVLLSTAIASAFLSASLGSIYVAINATTISTNNSTSYANDAVICENTTGNLGIYLKSGGPVAVAGNYDGSDDQVSVSISTGVLTCLAWQHASGSISIAKDNGSFSGVASGNTSTLTNVLSLGKNYVTETYVGDIIEVAIFDKALSAYEHLRMMNHLARPR